MLDREKKRDGARICLNMFPSRRNTRRKLLRDEELRKSQASESGSVIQAKVITRVCCARTGRADVHVHVQSLEHTKDYGVSSLLKIWDRWGPAAATGVMMKFLAGQVQYTDAVIKSHQDLTIAMLHDVLDLAA
jgi:hypothetical protein